MSEHSTITRKNNVMEMREGVVPKIRLTRSLT